MPKSTTIQPAAPAYSHEQIVRVVTGIMLCILLASLDQTVVIPAVPAIAAELNAFGHLSWIITAYLLTSTAATPIYGKLSDIYGRRALLRPALLLFIAASLACGFATSLPQLIVFRALQGLGGGGLFSMAQAAIADVVSPRERGRYQAYMASMWGISSIAGPIVGGWATDHLTWRWIFWVNLPLGLLALLLCERGLRILRHQRRPARIDWIGAVLLVAAVTTCLLVLSWGGVEMPWLSAPILSMIAACVVLVAALVWFQRRAPDPLLPPRLFANPTFAGGVATAFLATLTLFGATFLLPLYFQLELGFDAGASGLLVVPYLGSNVVGAMLSGQFARRLGRTRPIVLGGFGACVVGFAAVTILAAGAPLWAILAVSALLGVGTGATMPSVLMQVQNAAELRDVGAATGSLLFLRSMGGAFGSTVVGAVLAGRFAAGLHAAGLDRSVDLGALRRGGDAMAGLDGAALLQARTALASGFQLGFALCLVAAAIALGIAWCVKDVPLRSSALPKDIGH